MNRAACFLGAVSAMLDKVAILLAVLAVFVMVGAAGWQVVARYALDQPPVWTEVLARRAMIWAGLLGATVAFRARAEPTLFPSGLTRTGKAGFVLALIRATGVLLLAVPVFWFCFVGPGGDFSRSFLDRTSHRQAEMLDVSMVWFTSAIPLAFTLMTIHLVADLARRAADLQKDTLK